MILTGLRAARLAAALTQQELAERAGVRRATVGDLETGKQAARPGTTRRLAAALGVAPTDLMERVDAGGATLPARQGGWGPMEVGQ